MSYWVHVNVSIGITIYNKYQENIEFVKEMMELAPKITGSEGALPVHVVPVYHERSHQDCDFCPFRMSVRHSRGYTRCSAPDNYECKDIKFWDHYALVIHGSVRDRFKEQSKKELSEFLHWISSRDYGMQWDIHDVAASIKGTYSWDAFSPKGSFKTLSTGSMRR